MNRVVFVLISIYLTSSLSLAADSVKLDGLLCSEQMTKLVKTWRGIGNWEKMLGKDGPVHRKKTQYLGNWIVLNTQSKRPMVSLVSPTAHKLAHFGENCKLKLSVEKKEVPEGDFFTDESLLDFLVKTQKGLIVMWSTQMQHSQKAISRIKKLSKDMNLSTIYVADPNLDDSTVQTTLEKWKLTDFTIRKMKSVDLFFRDALIHFPAFFVVKNHKIVSKVIPGLMGEDSYREEIDAYFEE